MRTDWGGFGTIGTEVEGRVGYSGEVDALLH